MPAASAVCNDVAMLLFFQLRVVQYILLKIKQEKDL